MFHTAVLRARKEAYSQAVGVSQKYAAMAVATLVRVMNDPAAPASAKVSAGVALMKIAKEGVELNDLAARVDGLERSARGEVGQSAGAQNRPPDWPPMRLVEQEQEPEPEPEEDREPEDGG